MSNARVFCVGHAVQDFVFTVETLPTRGDKYQARGFQSVGGGPAATAAVAIARLGGRAMLAARIGADRAGDSIVAELEQYGVDCTHVRRFEGCRSSVSSVMVDDAGRRMIVNDLDPHMPDDASWLPDARDVGASAVLADVRWPAGSAHSLARAKRSGMPAVLDADRPIPRDAALFAAATHVAFSAGGIAEFTGAPDPVDGLRRAGDVLDTWCCVTVGEQGVHVLRHGALSHRAAYSADAVDTLGAGDVWHGAFALALAEGRDEDAAVDFASAAAALKVQRPGGRAGAPTRREVDEFLASQSARRATA